MAGVINGVMFNGWRLLLGADGCHRVLMAAVISTMLMAAAVLLMVSCRDAYYMHGCFNIYCMMLMGGVLLMGR